MNNKQKADITHYEWSYLIKMKCGFDLRNSFGKTEWNHLHGQTDQQMWMQINNQLWVITSQQIIEDTNDPMS